MSRYKIRMWIRMRLGGTRILPHRVTRLAGLPSPPACGAVRPGFQPSTSVPVVVRALRTRTPPHPGLGRDAAMAMQGPRNRLLLHPGG